MGCPDVLRSVACCANPPFSKAGQLVQECVGMADSLNSLIRVSANLAMYIYLRVMLKMSKRKKLQNMFYDFKKSPFYLLLSLQFQ